MKYAFFDNNGRIESAHNDNTTNELPAGAFELSDAEWVQRFDLLMIDGVLSVSALQPTQQYYIDRLLSVVSSERNRRWRGGFPVLIGGVTKWFHSDEFSLTQHLGLKDKARDLLAAGGVMTDNITIAGQLVTWSTMDGSQVQITAQVAFDIVAAGALNQALIFAAAQAHEAGITAATDLDNYDVLVGWPTAFVG